MLGCCVYPYTIAEGDDAGVDGEIGGVFFSIKLLTVDDNIVITKVKEKKELTLWILKGKMEGINHG